MGKKDEEKADRLRDAAVREIVVALNAAIRRLLKTGVRTHEDIASALLNMLVHHSIRAGLELSELVDVIAQAYGAFWLDGVRPIDKKKDMKNVLLFESPGKTKDEEKREKKPKKRR